MTSTDRNITLHLRPGHWRAVCPHSAGQPKTSCKKEGGAVCWSGLLRSYRITGNLQFRPRSRILWLKCHYFVQNQPCILGESILQWGIFCEFYQIAIISELSRNFPAALYVPSCNGWLWARAPAQHFGVCGSDGMEQRLCTSQYIIHLPSQLYITLHYITLQAHATVLPDTSLVQLGGCG